MAKGRGTGWFSSPNDIFERGDLTAHEKLVTLYLCRCVGPDGRAWPSYGRIAQQCDISRRTAITVMRALEAKGIVAVRPQANANGSPSSNLYELHFGNLAGATGPHPSATAALGSAGDAPPSEMAAPPGATDALPSATAAPGSAGDAPEGHPVKVTHKDDEDARTREPAAIIDPFGEAWPEIEQRFFECFGVPNPSHVEEITKLVGEGLSVELVAEALRRSSLAKARSWSYARRVMQTWLREGVRTVADVEALDAKLAPGQARASPAASLTDRAAEARRILEQRKERAG